MSDEVTLNKIVTIVMEDLRDKSINYFEKFIKGKWRSPSTQTLQSEFKEVL
ncbi:hypothetical protein [Paenibacillus sp. 22594]|uniref:hypothetical protein n=1 Tax=Paenibacillus sp. 22594 TaxID=3453947 RepID=UPI003F83C93A